MSHTSKAPLFPSIEDVASASSSAEFRNDVQLAQYRTTHNLELARDFIFTRKAASGRKSSTELLKYVCEAFMPGAPPNRFVFIATYGHGKSHFAVAAANYFGKGVTTPEAQGVLERIKHALQDASLSGFFESFKRNNRPSLILVLRGDEPSDLQTKFFRAVDDALRSDPQSSTMQAPFWYIEATHFLEGILKDKGAVHNANEFLANQQLDINVLIDLVKAQDASTYDITRELCLHLYHHTPDFGTGLSLKDGVEWLANNLVGKDKPYGSVLILFDEFSSFVRDYALRIQHRPGAPLQDLLNGVESTRGKVAFVAFAQRDPELVAKSLLGGDSLQSLITQLNRLPKPQHYQLHSSLEEVLAAYLKQDQGAWKKLLAHPRFSTELGQASDLCFEIFSNRYSETLDWDVERFQEVVAQGCFPLHPATTALLSSVELETTNNPRSVLGFVSKHLDLLRGASAYNGERPNWVLPITLVDYFREMLGEKSWNDFSDALSQAGGPDAAAEQVAVLKAMLLQTAGKVATKGAYSRVIAHFAGLSLERAASELTALASSGVIRHDQSKNIYMFWPAGKGANKVDQILSNKLQGCSLDASTLDIVNCRLRSDGLIGNISVPVPWGHQDDWQAEQMFVSRETLDKQSLQALAVSTVHWLPNGPAKSRGLVLWCVAESPDDAAWLRDTASEVLTKAFPGQNAPILVLYPNAAHPDFARQLLRLRGLSSFSNSEIAEVGEDQHGALLQLTVAALKSGFKSLKANSEVEVAAPFKARINAAKLRDLEPVLTEVFKLAHNSGPRRWFTQYKNGSTRLRNATARVAAYLLSNTLDTPDIFAADNLSKEVALQLKSEWGLLTSDLRIKQPSTTSNVRPAWDLLDGEFPPGAKSKLATQAITKLLNVPYGFDHNTVSLIVASWLGFHRHDLEVSVNGQLRPIKTLANDLKPKEFVELLASTSIKKTDADAVRDQIRQLLEKVDRGTFTQLEAQDALQLFAEAMERDDIDQKNAIEAAMTKLKGALSRAMQYDQAANAIEKATESQRSLIDLAKTLLTIGNLVVPEAVRPERLKPAELRVKLLEKLRSVTDSNSTQYMDLKSLSDFTLNEQQLKLMRKTLASIQLPDLVQVVDSALTKLCERKTELERQQEDERSLAVLESLETRGVFTQLNNNIATLEKLGLFSELTEKLGATKLAALRQELQRLEDFRSGIASRLDEVRDLRSLEDVRSDILRHVNLFDGSDHAGAIQQAIERCKRLRDFFESVESCRREVLRTPADAERVIGHLNGLGEIEAELSSTQHSVISDAVAGIQQAVERETQKAGNWLTECESAVEAGTKSVDDLLSALRLSPEFLPSNDLPRLETVRKKVRRLAENKQNEASALALLSGISSKGGLADLRKQLSVVEGLAAPTELVQKQINQKLGGIRQEIDRLEAFHTGISARLYAARDLRTVDDLRSDLLRNFSLFEGSERALDIQQSLDRCEKLREFFEAVETCGVDKVQSPGDANRIIRDLKVHLGETALSDVQRIVVSDAIARVEREVEKQSLLAAKWLEQCETVSAEPKKLDDLLARLQTPPAFLSETHRFRLQELEVLVRQKAEAQRVEASILATLKSISVKGSFVELKKQVGYLKSLPASTNGVRQQVFTKLAALQQELQRIEDFRSGIASRLDRVRDLRSLEDVRSDILRNVNLFDGSEKAGEIQQALDQCTRLREFFEAVESCRREVLRTPADAERVIADLNGLGNTGSEPSSAQRSVISDAVAGIQQTVERETQKAENWLAECESAVSGEKPVELARKLKSPPPFLPQNRKCNLSDLICKVNSRIDEDQILVVVMHFEQINDIPKRIECLNRLKALLDKK